MNPTHLSLKSSAKKRGLAVRVLLPLMDGNDHQVEEFYEWLVEGCEPQMAVRKLHQRNISDVNDWSLDKQIEEGRRIRCYVTLKSMERDGFVSVDWPGMESPRYSNSIGYYDPRKCIIRLTEEGMKHVMDSHGVFAKMVSELYTGLKNGRLAMSVQYLGNPNTADQQDLQKHGVLHYDKN